MSKLESTVIKGDYCIGCGICAVVSDNYKIELDSFGMYKSKYSHGHDNSEILVESYCPFSNTSKNESEISEDNFPGTQQQDSLLGSYNSLHIGYSNEYREFGASGGGTTWFLQKLLKENKIDGVIHLKENINNLGKKIFEYDISETASEILKASKTKYYPGELSGVLKRILDSNKKYAIVGVPCFLKGVRLLAENKPEYNFRIQYYVGLICGHYKSANYASMLAYQNGVDPNDIRYVDFRHKTGKGKAGSYNTLINYKEGDINKEVNTSVKNLYGTNWGLGMFKYNACEFCDDVVGECADISFGDAWISPYDKDPMGNNVIISRSEHITELIDDGVTNQELNLDEASKEQIIKTQLAGFRHRREGLKYRISKKVKKGEWFPTKRTIVQSSKNPTFRYKLIYSLRTVLSQKSHKFFYYAVSKKSFLLFKTLMWPYVFFYQYILYGPGKLKMFLNRILK